jgi:erythromycin esterase-like protein
VKKYNPQEFLIFTKEHNSDVGDAREMESSRARNINIGRLVRERFHIENIYDIGFTTYTGTVTAADN